MIQPTLDCYMTSQPPQPVLLSMSSMKRDGILLLDTFFQVVVWSGDNVVHWRKEKYHEKEEYAAFAALLKAPVDDAANIVKVCVERKARG
jgi:Vesicle coat complex COPII, subunit SEC23